MPVTARIFSIVGWRACKRSLMGFISELIQGANVVNRRRKVKTDNCPKQLRSSCKGESSEGFSSTLVSKKLATSSLME